MIDQVRFTVLVLVEMLVLSVDTDCAFFVVLAHADTDGNWVDGYIHHDEETELDRRIHRCEIKRRCSCVARRRGLEDGSENAWAHWEGVDFWVVKVEHYDEEGIEEV
jgi:hypothetical protein